MLDVQTPGGLARLHLDDPAGDAPSRPSAPSGPSDLAGPPTGSGPAKGLLVLGHGAGGGVAAADLVEVTSAVTRLGWLVARLEQPWRVAGRKVAPAPARLDAVWVPVLAELVATTRVRGPLVVGGRSAGARVACRTAAATGADAVVCLAFPLHPPGRPERSRLPELAVAAARTPVLAVQGRRDAFGTAEELAAVAPPGATVVAVDGDHGLAAGARQAAAEVASWLAVLSR